MATKKSGGSKKGSKASKRGGGKGSKAGKGGSGPKGSKSAAKKGSGGKKGGRPVLPSSISIQDGILPETPIDVPPTQQ